MRTNDTSLRWREYLERLRDLRGLEYGGVPCSKSCNGSQAGRGGSFFSLRQATLHKSLSEGLISGAYRCAPPPPGSSQQLGDGVFDTLVLHDPVLPAFEELEENRRVGSAANIER
ncbi:hypothetical protein PHYPSEUDO_000357 [Phytophthora pseudosyringae]|uniref:Uncharacterized protein n=1 Tax=Phytophthora pseudosyringae TaxID=221518 RepID=A0A8T1V2Z9_9STRA|nr:hypothetical protein PHYPSEUDO_000357 [Phytophthora pseudosyringae]